MVSTYKTNMLETIFSLIEHRKYRCNENLQKALRDLIFLVFIILNLYILEKQFSI